MMEKDMKDVLDYIWTHIGCSTSDIIEGLGVSPERVSKTLQSLCEAGEIEQACIISEG